MLRFTEVMGVSGPVQGLRRGQGEAQGRVDDVESLAAAPPPPTSVRATATLTLTFGDRRRSRLLVRLDDGREAALMLPRGTVLREGDHLRSETGQPIVRVRSAVEVLSVARTTDALLLSRAAYHLGNRHVPLQIGPGWLAYQHDHVLDELARTLGLTVTTESGPFEPEAGGYRHEGSSHEGSSHEGSPHEGSPNEGSARGPVRHGEGLAQDEAHDHAHRHGSDHGHGHGHGH